MYSDEGDGNREEGDTSMLPQPETKPITQEQLVNEVKGIYAGLVVSSPPLRALVLMPLASPLLWLAHLAPVVACTDNALDG